MGGENRSDGVCLFGGGKKSFYPSRECISYCQKVEESFHGGHVSDVDLLVLPQALWLERRWFDRFLRGSLSAKGTCLSNMFEMGSYGGRMYISF